MPGATADPRTWLRQRSRWSWFEIAFWVATLLPFLVFPTYLTLASQIAIAALFALSLDLVLGYAGIVTLGHAMFFGIGAYAAGLISRAGWGEPLSGLLLGGWSKYKPIAAADVAKSMVAAANKEVAGVHMYEYDEMKDLIS